MFGDVFAETYPWDRELIDSLGLKRFCIKRDKRGFGKQAERYLGTLKEGGISIRVYVTALPAQFYRFEVKDNKRKYEIETGSGQFNKYYPMLKEILDGMVVFNTKIKSR